MIFAGKDVTSRGDVHPLRMAICPELSRARRGFATVSPCLEEPTGEYEFIVNDVSLDGTRPILFARPRAGASNHQLHSAAWHAIPISQTDARAGA